MRIYESIASLPKTGKTIVAIGIFDGVHLGHQQLLQQLCSNAKKVGGETMIITFWPHPKLVLTHTHATPIQILTTFEEKATILARMGIDYLLKIPFTKAFSQTSAHDFVQQVLVQVEMTQLVVGHGHRFGKDRVGNVALLQQAGRYHHFAVSEIPLKSIHDIIISSTKIRELLLKGDVEQGCAYLGRPYEMQCSILQQILNGDRHLKMHLTASGRHKIIPADGLYNVQAVHHSAINEGILRIVRQHDTCAPIMELVIANYASTTRHIHNLCIRFNSNRQETVSSL